MRRSFYVKAFDTTSIAILIILAFKKFKAKKVNEMNGVGKPRK
jgi:hypothetical protein